MDRRQLAVRPKLASSQSWRLFLKNLVTLSDPTRLALKACCAKMRSKRVTKRRDTVCQESQLLFPQPNKRSTILPVKRRSIFRRCSLLPRPQPSQPWPNLT